MFKRMSVAFTAAFIVMTISLGFFAYAQNAENTENEITVTDSYISVIAQPMYEYTYSVLPSLSISGEKAACTTVVSGYSGTTTKIQIKMTLQKRFLFWWNEEESWSSTTNGYSATLYKTAAVDSGTYRVKAEITVYSGSKSETITQYSAEKSA